MSESLSLLIPPLPMPDSCRRLYVLSPAFAHEESIVLICVNWSMTCWSTEECPEATTICRVLMQQKHLVFGPRT